MAYTPTDWENKPSTATPIDADNLNKLEQGVVDAHNAIDSVADDVGSLAFSDISGTATAGQIPSLAQSKITGLTAALNSKLEAVAVADVDGLQAALDAKADDDHDHAGVYATPAQVNAKADADHGHDIGDVSGLQAALDALSDRLDALEGEG